MTSSGKPRAKYINETASALLDEDRVASLNGMQGAYEDCVGLEVGGVLQRVKHSPEFSNQDGESGSAATRQGEPRLTQVGKIVVVGEMADQGCPGWCSPLHSSSLHSGHVVTLAVCIITKQTLKEVSANLPDMQLL